MDGRGADRCERIAGLLRAEPAGLAWRELAARAASGGVLSNTPVEVVFDDDPRRSSPVFSVHVCSPQEAEPDTLAKVVCRKKDLRCARRTTSHTNRQRQLHKLRQVVRLLAPPLYGKGHGKDMDFPASGIRQRLQAGYRDTARVLEQEPWAAEFGSLEGFVLHKAASGTAAV